MQCSALVSHMTALDLDFHTIIVWLLNQFSHSGSRCLLIIHAAPLSDLRRNPLNFNYRPLIYQIIYCKYGATAPISAQPFGLSARTVIFHATAEPKTPELQTAQQMSHWSITLP